VFLLVVLVTFSQNSNKEKSLLAKPDTLKNTEVKHSVRKATFLSVILPGAGQVYNKKYWKVPIVYVAFAGLGYLVKTNNDEYNKYKQAYIFRTDNNAGTVDGFEKYTEDNLLTLKNAYQRSRDFAIIGVAAVYVLNIIDAAVDAHLYTFDVSDNLTLRVYPTFIFTAQNFLPKTGLSISLKF